MVGYLLTYSEWDLNSPVAFFLDKKTAEEYCKKKLLGRVTDECTVSNTGNHTHTMNTSSYKLKVVNIIEEVV